MVALAQKRVAKYGARARVFVGDAEAIDAPDSAWPIRALFDHPQATQFYGSEFRAGLETAGLRVQKWQQWGEWGMMGRASKWMALEQVTA